MIQLSVTIVALILFIEILDKERLKYEVENSRWGIMIDENGKAITFLSLEGPCFVTGSLLSKDATA